MIPYNIQLWVKSVIPDKIQSKFWSLPCATKRITYQTFNPIEYLKLKRSRVLGTVDYSLKPFDDHKCIFVHIPKTAGISITKSLFGNLGAGHMTIKKYQIIFNNIEFNSYFKFTFVRNPWDRLVSAYNFLKKGGFDNYDKFWAQKNLSNYMDFDSFVKNGLRRKSVQSWKHFVPQYKFICSEDGMPMVDFIGYFENLDNDFSYVQKKLGISSNSKLLHLNKSMKRNDEYKEYYTEETKKIVEYVYHKDIQLLGYNFDGRLLKNQLTTCSEKDFR
jgi:hypothetical protein